MIKKCENSRIHIDINVLVIGICWENFKKPTKVTIFKLLFKLKTNNIAKIIIILIIQYFFILTFTKLH